MLNITEIAFTGYPVTDMPRARAFYEGVLNLKVASEFEHEGKQWIEYELGTGTFAISNMAAEWKPSADGPSVAFEVQDFDAALAAVGAAGVRCVAEVVETPVCRFAVILDPDGNSITLHRRNTP